MQTVTQLIKVTFMRLESSAKIVSSKMLDNCNEFAVVEFKLKRRMKGNHQVRLVNTRLQHMTELFVLRSTCFLLFPQSPASLPEGTPQSNMKICVT
jgi:hypothetical protein